MVDVIDQSWCKAWANSTPTPEEVKTIIEWVQGAPPAFHEMMTRFPPLCLVRGKRALEVPFLFTVGIVRGYFPDGRLSVQQEPNKEEVPVSPDDLEVAGFWKGFSHDQVQRHLPKRNPHAQSP